MKFKSYETEDFLAGAVKVPVEVAVEVASSRLLFASFAVSSFSSKFVLDYASMERISIGLLNTTCFVRELARLVLGTIF